ncbi:hypothetical protein OAE49_06630, partial [Gammaproteobacteria bacterium]|nr:hypothetical protein [Gammaproteobacteria bacterium]
QITVAETLGLEKRGSYYDHTGAIKDMLQNHLLQILCLVAMEPPTSINSESIRDEKLKVLRSLRDLDAKSIAEHCVIGQYKDGAIDSKPKWQANASLISIDESKSLPIGFSTIIEEEGPIKDCSLRLSAIAL